MCEVVPVSACSDGLAGAVRSNCQGLRMMAAGGGDHWAAGVLCRVDAGSQHGEVEAGAETPVGESAPNRMGSSPPNPFQTLQSA